MSGQSYKIAPNGPLQVYGLVVRLGPGHDALLPVSLSPHHRTTSATPPLHMIRSRVPYSSQPPRRSINNPKPNINKEPKTNKCSRVFLARVLRAQNTEEGSTGTSRLRHTGVGETFPAAVERFISDDGTYGRSGREQTSAVRSNCWCC